MHSARAAWTAVSISIALCGPARAQLASPVALQAADAAMGELFGFTASVSSNRAVVGSHKDGDQGHESGSAYVFERVSGAWQQVAELHGSDSVDDDWFGFAVSVDGDVALIGAPHADGGVDYQAGAAYVFERVSGVWTETAKLVASDAASTDFFGRAVSISGTRALIGAYSSDRAFVGAGSAYVFEQQGGAWVEVARLEATDAAENDSFGFALSLHGARALIGAPRKSDAGEHSGAAYVFEPVGGAWTELAKLVPGDTAAKDRFGHAVSLYGERALIGSIQGDAAAVNSGSAYLFEHSGGVWTESAEIGASDGQPIDQFGQALALGADRMLVGARFADAYGHDAGAAYLFEQLGSGWVQTTRLGASEPQPDANFGDAIALWGERGFAGASPGTGTAHVVEACSGELALEFPVRIAVVQPGGGSEETTLGTLAVSVTSAGRLEAMFVLDPLWAHLDDCLDFDWIEVEKRLLQGGLPLAVDPALGPLPAVFPPASVDPDPYFWSAAEWAAGKVQGETIRVERRFSRLLRPAHLAPGAPDEVELHTYLAARDVTGRTLASNQTALLAGFAWRYEGVGDRAYLCGRVELGEALVQAAIDAAATGCPGHAGCPGFPGWTLATATAIEPCQILSGAPGALSVAAGGAQTLAVDAGPANAGRMYLIVGSTSGTQPGLTLGPYAVPLVVDGYFAFTVASPNQPPLSASLGVLDASGQAAAGVGVAAGAAPALVGLTVHHAAVVIGSAAEIVLTSEAVGLDLLP